MVYEDFKISVEYKSSRQLEMEMRELRNAIELMRAGGEEWGAKYKELVHQIYASEAKRRCREAIK